MKIEKPEKIKTPWGNAKINKYGYYRITSSKEGNNGKYLHRLIYEANFGPIPDDYDIHHINGDKLDNCIYNLKTMTKSEHHKLHNSGVNNPLYGKTLSEEIRQRMSQSRNTSGYLNVCKRVDKGCKQGFLWLYRYTADDGTRKSISSTDINKLERKVRKKGLLWKKYE